MLHIGDDNVLKIVKDTEQGYYLDSTAGEILLPNKYITPEMEIGQLLSVFIYRDSEDRLVATTEKPLAKVGEFAFLQVKDINSNGLFLNWGLEKDLLLPYREKRGEMVQGLHYVVKVLLDPITERIMASARLDNHFENETLDLSEGQQVDLLVYHSSDLGYQVVVNNRYRGLIYRNQVFHTLKIGERCTGTVQKIREGNKLDIALSRDYQAEREAGQETILRRLTANDGFLPWHDKTAAEVIQKELGISKKTFKKAIGGLYRQKQIVIKENGIYLPENKE